MAGTVVADVWPRRREVPAPASVAHRQPTWVSCASVCVRWRPPPGSATWSTEHSVGGFGPVTDALHCGGPPPGGTCLEIGPRTGQISALPAALRPSGRGRSTARMPGSRAGPTPPGSLLTVYAELAGVEDTAHLHPPRPCDDANIPLAGSPPPRRHHHRALLRAVPHPSHRKLSPGTDQPRGEPKSRNPIGDLSSASHLSLTPCRPMLLATRVVARTQTDVVVRLGAARTCHAMENRPVRAARFLIDPFRGRGRPASDQRPLRVAVARSAGALAEAPDAAVRICGTAGRQPDAPCWRSSQRPNGQAPTGDRHELRRSTLMHLGSGGRAPDG